MSRLMAEALPEYDRLLSKRLKLVLGYVWGSLALLCFLAFAPSQLASPTAATWTDDRTGAGTFHSAVTPVDVESCRVRGLLVTSVEIVWSVPGHIPSQELLDQTEITVEGEGILGGLIRLPLSREDYSTSLGSSTFTTTVPSGVLSSLLAGEATIDMVRTVNGTGSDPSAIQVNVALLGLGGTCTVL